MIVTGRYHKKSLYQRIFYTFLCLLLYRLCSAIPLPFINRSVIQSMFDMSGSFGMLNILTGGNLSRMSIATLGISPYITASIMIQLLGVLIPSLAELQKSGAVGQKKIRQLTLIGSFIAALPSATGLMSNYAAVGILTTNEWYGIVIPCILMIGASMLFALLGNYIDEHFFGNGISLFLFVGIVTSIPQDIMASINVLRMNWSGNNEYIAIGVFVFVVLLMVMFICWLLDCEQTLKVFGSRKAVTDVDMVRDESVLPIKMLTSNVLPVIFASSFLAFPSMIQTFFHTSWVFLDIFNMNKWFDSNEPFWSCGILIYFLLIFIFSRYSQSLNMNEMEIAERLKNSGYVIEGITPGRETEIYLRRQMRVANVWGSVGLCVVAFVPILASHVFGLPSISLLGTSLILIVSIVKDTWFSYQCEKHGYKYVKLFPRLLNSKNDADSFCVLMSVR